MENKNKQTELTKYMTIGISGEEQCGVRISPDMDAATALQLVGTLSLHILNAFYAVAEASINSDEDTDTKYKEVALQGIKESMYDAADSMFSNVLLQFYPDAPKNDIEEEAILELTNKKIEERYNKLSPEARKEFKRKYQVMKLKMQMTPHETVNSETSETA